MSSSGACQFCGKEGFKNTGSHERQCKHNPANEKKTMETAFKEVSQEPVKKSSLQRIKSFLTRKAKPKQEIKEVSNPEELISDLPRWAIKERKPLTLFNKNKHYVQVVLVSKTRPPEFFWTETDGLLIRTKNRAYKLPHDVRGNVFFWNRDKKEPLIDNVTEKDAQSSLHILQVFNIAYSLGRQMGAQDLLNKLGFVTIMLIVAVVGEAILGYYIHGQFKDMTAAYQTINTALQNSTRQP